jgi:hypothetical protein
MPGRVAGDLDHGRRQVDPGDVQPQARQVRADPALPAAEVGDKPASGGADVLGERGEHRPVQRQRVELAPDELRVAGGHGVVGRGGHREPFIEGGHGRRS